VPVEFSFTMSMCAGLFHAVPHDGVTKSILLRPSESNLNGKPNPIP